LRNHNGSNPCKQVATLVEGLPLSTSRKDAKKKAQARGSPITLLFWICGVTKHVESPTQQFESLLQDTALDPDATAIVRAARDLIQKIRTESAVVELLLQELGEVVVLPILVERMPRARGLSAAATFSTASPALSTAEAFSTASAFFVHSQEQAPRVVIFSSFGSQTVKIAKE